MTRVWGEGVGAEVLGWGVQEGDTEVWELGVQERETEDWGWGVQEGEAIESVLREAIVSVLAPRC